MAARRERSLHELYKDDPERADALAFGRRSGPSRRGFLGGSGLAAMAVAVGGSIPFAASLPTGLIPAAMAQTAAEPDPKTPTPFDYPGKDPGLTLLGDRPLVAETPEHLLDDQTTPIEKFFIRNNGQIPDAPENRNAWKISIDGEVDKPLEITLEQLKERFQPQTYFMVLECGGNGRSFFTPQARGNQWTNGGAGCGQWTGVRLADVLKAAGVKDSAKYTAHYGADVHLSGDPSKSPLSRGMPMAKAMEEHNLIVWSMNETDLPNIHGGPVRLLIPGWPGSLSHKWLNRIVLRDREHDGQGMTGTSYRVPIKPMIPGTEADPANFSILESMPVRSIITNPANGTRLPAGTTALALRGAAWAGDHKVERVDISTDFGASWTAAALGEPRNRYDWVRWTADVKLPSDGYFEIWSRATDDRGVAQPHIAGNWNPQGYGGNPMHRIAVLAG